MTKAKEVSIPAQTPGVVDETLVVKPRRACEMLDVGLTRLYELLNDGELESYKDGSSRKITTRSIRAYIERRVASAQPSRAA